jgi:dTDP-4-amino-4,6-dideoxygalactose transaminase
MLATGEGGMVVSKSPEIIARIRDLKSYDGKPADTVRYNYKMTDLQAAMGEVQLGRLHEFIRQRRKIARQYRESFKSSNLRLPVESDEHIYYRFVVGLEVGCDGFIRKLAQKAVGCARPVFLPIHRHLKQGGYPVTDKVWETSLSIPIYPSLDNSEIEKIIAGVLSIC